MMVVKMAQLLALLLLPRLCAAAVGGGSSSSSSAGGWSFRASAAPAAQQRLFGTALQQGWFGADLSLSVPVGPDGRHLWLFGDSYVGTERSGGALCNGVEASTCAMVPQSVALSGGGGGLEFIWAGQRPNVSSTPTRRRPQALLPVPASLQPPSLRGRTCSDCTCTPLHGACAETASGASDCCHTVDYLWLLSALATPDGSQLVFLADTVRDNATRKVRKRVCFSVLI